MRRRRRRGYKFTEKKQSKRGMIALMLAVMSLVVLVVVVVNSFQNHGNGSMYLGSAGVAAMLLGIVASVVAIKSMKEENSFKAIPYAATVTSFLATVAWMSLYVVGYLG